MQKQIKKKQDRQRQKQLAVIMALVNGLNMAAPLALTAADTVPVRHGEPGRELASLSRGVRVLDSLFFSTAYAYTTTVNSGETVNDETLNGSEFQTVNSGGTTNRITISGGTQDVNSGGTANNTTISGGNQYIAGGTANNTIINGGYQQILGGTANSTTINTGEMWIFSGGSASGTTVSGGTMKVAAGNATSTTVNNGGWMYVSSGCSASGTTINNLGTMYVSGGSATGTTVNNFGYLTVSSGGTANSTTVNSSGTMNVSSGGSAEGTTIGGGTMNVISGGSAKGTRMSSGLMYVFSSGSVKDTTISGGAMDVYDDGSAEGTTIENGFMQIYNNGSAQNTTVNSGGRLRVFLGSAKDTTVNSGGVLDLGNPGATLSGDTTLNGGTLSLMGSGDYTAGGILTVSGGSVDLTGGSRPGAAYARRSLTINKLTGNASFIINTDLAKSQADHIAIKSGDANAAHTVKVAYDPLYKTHQSTAQTYSAEFAKVDTGATFTAVSTEYSGYIFVPTLAHDDTSTAWSVTGFTVDKSGPGPVSGASTLAYNAAGTAAGSAVLWRQENNSLTRRLGEIRDGNGGGDWARVYKGEIEGTSFGRSVKQQYTALQGGHDTLVPFRGRDWYVGYTIGYLDASSSMEKGGGDASSLTIGGYAAWLGDKGHYLDLIVKQGRLKNDYYSYDTSNNKISGGYHAWGTSLSAEYGYRKELKNSWYVEPQAELTFGRIGSANYTLSDGTAVNQASITSVVGRLGVAAGRKLGDAHFYAKTSLLREFNADAQTTLTASGLMPQAMTESLKETWLEFAVGVTGSLSDKMNGYLELSRMTGGDKSKTPWQVNLGARWNF